MTKTIHDLTDTLPWVDGVKSKCRQYVGHYGDTYVLPSRCYIGKVEIGGDTYGRIYFQSPKGGKGTTLTVDYSDDECNAYEKFMRKLAKSEYCAQIRECERKYEEHTYGESSSRAYVELGLPKINGITIVRHREKIRFLGSKINGVQTATCFKQEHMCDKNAIIQVFKKHLAKMSPEWMANHHIPEIYLG